MGYDLSEYLRQTLSYQFRADDIYHVKDSAPQAIHDEVGYKFYDIIGSKLAYDRRDSTFDPRSGYFITLDTSLAVPRPRPSVQHTQERQVHQRHAPGRIYYPLLKEVTLSATSEVGYIQPLFGDYLHYPDGFFLGGPDSLRGFDTHGVGPRDPDAKKKYGSIGGQFLWNGTLQASFPLGLPEEYQIRGRVFSDFGVLTGTDAKRSDSKIDDDGSIRASAGFGITWVSPFGPLAVDLAYPVVRNPKTRSSISASASEPISDPAGLATGTLLQPPVSLEIRPVSHHRFRSLLTGIAASAGLMLAAIGLPQTAGAQTATQPAAPAQAPAQAIPVVIGILDTEAVVLGSSAGKSLTQQANAQLKALQDATQKQEDVLIAKLKALNPQAPDYATQRQTLAQADDKLRNDFGTNKDALDQRVDKARQSLLQAATKVIQDIAQGPRPDADPGPHQHAALPDQWNITPDVVARLNKALPSIKL